MIKRALSVILSALMIVSVFSAVSITANAEEIEKSNLSMESGNYAYSINDDNTAQIETYFGEDEKLVIPKTLGGYTVTSIGANAFEECEGLSSISIPDSITSIGGDAFYATDYYYDESKWENGVLYIGNYLIKADPSVVKGNYTIKAGTTTIASYAFSECEELTGVKIPESVKNIGDYAFEECVKLIDINLPRNIKSIGDNTFVNCAFSSVNVPDGVTSIGSLAFGGCNNLREVKLPDSLKSLGTDAFYETAFYDNAENWNDNALYIGKTLAAVDTKKIQGDYSVKDGTVVIAEEAFQNSEGLTGVTIPESVDSIPNNAFMNCGKLSSVTLPDTIKEISSTAFDNSAFYNNNDNWDNDVLYIDNCLIKAKNTISGQYYVKDGTVTIASGAFYNCAKLNEVKIPDSVKNINFCAFYLCKNLSKLALGNAVDSIGNWAFGSCALKQVRIPDSVTSIGQGAFGYSFNAEEETDTKIKNFALIGSVGGTAEKYAKKNGFAFYDNTKPIPKAPKEKKDNPVKVTASTKKIKAKDLQKKKQTVSPLKISNAKGSVKVSLVKKGTDAKIKKKIKVNGKTGAITIKKGNYKKKKYQINLTITVAGNSNYKAKKIDKTVSIKIK